MSVALLRHALAALDPPNPMYDEMHDQIEKLVNSIAPMPPKGVTKRTAVTAKKK